MGAYPVPLSYVPPIPTWGSETFEHVDSMELFAQHRSVTDPLEFLAAIVRLVSPYLGSGTDSLDLLVDDSDEKQSTKDDPTVFTAESLFQWYSRGLSSTFRLLTERLRCMIHAVDDGQVIATSLTLREPTYVEVDALASCFIEEASLLRGLHGFVGLGSGWASVGARATSIRGYGPAVVAAADDLDLETVDQSLVTLTSFDDGRIAIRTDNDADQVTAISEVRRLCWPGLGYRYARSSQATTLFLEGSWSPRSMMGLIAPERFIHGEIKLLLAEVDQNVRSDEVSAPGYGLIAAPNGLTDMQVADLQRVLAAWQRGATAATPPEHLSLSGWVEYSLEQQDESFLLRHGPCSAGAIQALEKCLTRWSRLFDSAPIAQIAWQDAATEPK